MFNLSSTQSPERFRRKRTWVGAKSKSQDILIMKNYSSICICGGGGLGHTIAACVSNKGYNVNLLTGHPFLWSNEIETVDCNNEVIKGHINKISNRAEDVIPMSDIILLCVPGYLITDILISIAPYINNNTEIGSVVSSSGFFWMAHHILGDVHRLFGFQRVPYICRVNEYGRTSELKGYKALIKIGGNEYSDTDALASFFTDALRTKTIVLNHWLEAALTNSNPILHPSRIYGMLSPFNSDLYDKEFLFYEEWDDYSSDILVRCDSEFQQLISNLPINRKEIPSLLDYYDVSDTVSLTEKIRSIPAFKGIKMKMIADNGKFRVDYGNRYFTEDIPYGLLIIKSLGVILGEETPMIDKVIYWMQEHMGKEYLVNGHLSGKNISDTGIIQNFNIKTLEQLYNLS